MGRKKKNKNIEEDETEEKSASDWARLNLGGDAKRSAVAVVLFALAVISVLGFFGLAGSFGDFMNKMIAYSIGYVKFIFPISLIFAGVVLLLRRETAFYVTKFIGLGVSLVSFAGIFHWFYKNGEMLKYAQLGKGGGYIGYGLSYFLEKYLGLAGSLVVLLALLLLGIILAFNFSIVHFFLHFKKEKKQKESAEDEESEDEDEDEGETEEDSKEEESVEEKLPEDNTKETAVEENIGKIEFVEGRDQFVSPLSVNEEQAEPEGSSEKIMERRSLDVEPPSKKFKFPKNAKNPKWNYPTPDMLEKTSGTAQGGDIESNFTVIEKTLKDFGIQVERGTAKIGPSVTQYSFRPAVGVKIAKILALQNDLSLALAAHPIRIEAPIPGQSLIGIEIPNKTSLIVRLRDMIEESQFQKRESDLMLALGEDVGGNCVLGDLSKMPHLMIAGATGTGKSVCINSVITTLLYQNSPEDLKFIMVDPKRVELSLYNGIPHLLTDVIVDNGKVVNTLKWAVGEMERRYRLLQDAGSRDMTSYREKLNAGHKITRTDSETGEVIEEELTKMPYIVIVIDELADLMGSHGKEVEGAIVRIAQMARAVGIHLIVSTQRPSVEVITGLIKANITTRIAFQVATQIDSRTILDMGGAEKLLGNGDLLFLSSSSPKPKRIQGVFVSESEVKRVVKFIKDQNKEEKKEDDDESEDITVKLQKEITEFKTEESNGEDEDLLKQVEEEIIRTKKASASYLQRRFRVGYARAARILDILEEKGIIGPADGAKPREVYGVAEEGSIEYENNIEDQGKRDKWEI
jgi:S-DNA-T family DNA segregation ATPase FtsK/SpoIIIE